MPNDNAGGGNAPAKAQAKAGSTGLMNLSTYWSKNPSKRPSMELLEDSALRAGNTQGLQTESFWDNFIQDYL